MRKFNFLFSAVSLLLINQGVHAEGTREVSPNEANHSALVSSGSTYKTGPYKDAPESKRIYFTINSTSEKFYMGSTWTNYGNNTNRNSDMRYRIFDADNNIVVNESNLITGTTGVLANFSDAGIGPKVGAKVLGYIPRVFEPTVTGTYSIEVYARTGSADAVKASYFDFVVIDTLTWESKNGRVFNHQWAFVAIDNASNAPTATASASPSIYSYSHDETIVKLSFQEGFKPILYDLVVNDYGVDNTVNWNIGRKSVNASVSPVYNNNFKLFLNVPDTSIFPVTPLTASPYFTANPVEGCAGDIHISFMMPAEGDARLILNLNGVEGYQPGTKDIALEGFNLPIGVNTIVWNGKDGEGNTVLEGVDVEMEVVYQRGRFNLPIYDAEINKNGINLETIAPLHSATNRLYWDDSGLTNIGTSCTSESSTPSNNVTGSGINNTIVGQVTPAHAWSGDGNLAQLIPAPSVSGNETNTMQCDDFGNVRVINSWGWALEQSSAPQFFVYGCFDISGSVFNDVNGLTDSLVNGDPINMIGEEPLFVYLVNSANEIVQISSVSADGSYSFSDVKGLIYSIILSTEVLEEGDLLTHSTLPAEWVFKGEQIGDLTTDIDPLTNGIHILAVRSDISDVNFGIQRKPIAEEHTLGSTLNPGGSETKEISASDFVVEDFDGGEVVSFHIPSFPTNTNTIEINGVLYTNDNWPLEGVTFEKGATPDENTLMIDPVDGDVTVVIEFVAIDNAGDISTETGKLNIPFHTIKIGGTVYNDGNGLTDGLINGTPFNLDDQLYAYLVDTNTFEFVKVAVNSDGTFEFENLNGGDYTVVISDKDLNIITSLDELSIDENWVFTGESKTDASSSETIINGIIHLGKLEDTNENLIFGLNKRPIPNAKNVHITTPTKDDELTFDGLSELAVPNAEDFEEGTISNDRTLIVTTIPTNVVLLYDGVPVVENEPITDFDPTLLSVQFTEESIEDLGTSFDYYFEDEAGVGSTTSATYTITWDAPLSVQYAEWNLSVQNNQVVLNWMTANELNNSGFEIQRSNNASNWNEVGFVSANSSSKSYQFIDKQPLNGKNYYRLVDIDHHNNRSFSTVKVAEIFNVENVSLYPNPVSEFIFINKAGIENVQNVTIFNAIGKNVYNSNVLGNSINVQNLPAGNYYLQIMANNQLINLPFVKQ